MSHLSIPRYSTANRLAEQSADYKRQHGAFAKVPRRLSSQLSSDKSRYQFDQEEQFEEELPLDLDSTDNRYTNV